MTGIAQARRLLDETPAGTASAWPRAAAVLARQDLEDALAEFWGHRAPLVSVASGRAQLSCLRAYLPDEEAAEAIAFAWAGLSRATHHRPYELDPTRAELGWLIDEAERGVAVLTGGQEPGGGDD